VLPRPAIRFMDGQLAHPECHRQSLAWCYLKIKELLNGNRSYDGSH